MRFRRRRIPLTVIAWVSVVTQTYIRVFVSDAVGASPPRDPTCEQKLAERGIEFQPLAELGLVKTPVLVFGRIGPLVLVPRGRRLAEMDCTLAVALSDAAPVFVQMGLVRLSFSAAHDHRTRRDLSKLSAHALGLAIDVHTLDGPAGEHDVLRDFEKGVGSWLGLERGDGALVACIGAPTTPRGRTLRTLACRLKLETTFRIVVTPDDNDDHIGHLHLEHAPTGRSGVIDGPHIQPPVPSPVAVPAARLSSAKLIPKTPTKATPSPRKKISVKKKKTIQKTRRKTQDTIKKSIAPAKRPAIAPVKPFSALDRQPTGP